MNITTRELQKRSQEAYELLRNCKICPRKCFIDRLNNQRGYCGIGKEAVISNFGPHFGEESVLVGLNGSGTIFFAGCNLKCIYCQNYEISHLKLGEERSFDEIANMMLSLQKLGCHNINFVTPTHVIPQILKALVIAYNKGLHVPLVYNSGGYDSIDTLKLLDGVIDIYMPDAKYADRDSAKKYSDAPDYPLVMKQVLKEMHRQVGNLVVDENNLAQRGLLIRHLVLPGNIAGSHEVLKFIAGDISKNSFVNIMDQYRPCYLASKYTELSHSITCNEFNKVTEFALQLGLHRGF